ncbi:putative membrane protein YeaQ/YmgE (transglycosylase-associated protein family) [Arcanobacterium pluranimalium]|uniref:GlsB/YeaQ/YmgE family stress response membrane protein n=1 Tax=Arcanobacterium pluranimalium TaxID=108028 RepID=UPI00195D0B11|nr:GlsB/YeaQ/YmgE family stress response membrane protein [Arcanobacterium pluranimalium]MBM7824534.1 putative membrane protein YeaQ/YmgE (transglycosylase-associated protein family) [Arcanobacterium pluranimalium]
MLGNIIGTLIFGLVIGALARLFMKGNQNISILATMLLGAAGVAVANLVLQLFHYSANTPGIDWIRWIVSTIFAIIAISIYLGVRSGSKR